MIERQAGQMVRLLEDLLDISRITHNKLMLHPESLNLAVVVDQAVETARPLIDAGGHIVKLELPPDPTVLVGDPARLNQVFSNLLSNAAKYSEKGGCIQVAAKRCEEEIVVSVKDSGIGITAEHLPRIFDVFSQVDSALSHSQDGLGIGLSLVKRLVEMHGGHITAHSDGLNQGSEFIVHLPIAASSRLKGQRL